tara:strand:+ start:209 stop:517 length:309 start_codon:yes stop_codon:yes gene_type:complete
MEPWKRVKSDDPEIEELQDNAEPIMRQVENAFSLGGVLLKNKTIATEATDINHGLGRAPQGFVIVRQRADARVWDLQDDNNNSTKSLTLIASAEVDVDVWIF